LLEIQSDLLENPERGRVIQGTAGVRKARVADPTRGKGKSKNDQADLTSMQKKTLKQAILGLREEHK